MSLQSYKHRIRPGALGAPILFAFHGTGGDENQFFDFAARLMPQATIVSPRGDVSEGGALRFFRRKAEGVYDMDDLAIRRDALAAFVAAHRDEAKAGAVYGLGYSNGANILAAMMLENGALFDGAVLMHPLIPWAPAANAALKDRDIVITAGRRDPICPPAETQVLADYFSAQGAAVKLEWHEGGHDIRPNEVEAAQAFASRLGVSA
ncbi:phospholipase/carboxylesterase [Rhizobium albus]|nr:phospholipase/carboxylesterase [Rhizobium albus]